MEHGSRCLGMSMIKLTVENVTAALHAAVAEKGEGFVYRRPEDSDACLYVHRNDGVNLTTGCLVGNALHRLGVPLEALEECNIGTACELLDMLIEDGAIEHVPHKAAVLLSEAQQEQDRDVPWGAAVRRALGYIESLEGE